jgi:hypothetical protein
MRVIDCQQWPRVTRVHAPRQVIAIDAKDAELDIGGGVGAILAEVTIGGQVFGSDDSWKCYATGVVGVGARSHCCFVPPTHPLHTRFTNIFGTSILKRQCDQTLGRGRRPRDSGSGWLGDH